MKKRRIRSCMFSALFLVLIMSISVSGISESAFTAQKNTDKAATIIDCDKENLNFVRTVNTDIPLGKDETGDDRIAPSTLDTYVDENNNTFYYLGGTNTLCGFQKEYYYGFQSDSPISEEKAVQIADEFLGTVIEEFDEYTLIFSEYAERDAVYHLQYSYCINDIPTDDLINMFVQENGEIGAFLMKRRGLYKDIVLPKNFSVPNDANNVIRQYISLSDEGLALVRTYEERSSDDIPVIQQEAVLIQSIP